MNVSDFIGTLGVNTHIGSDPYNDPAVIAAMLSYLGIGNVRQSAPVDAASRETIAALGRGGARIDLIINGGGPVSLAGAMGDVTALAPYLNAVEGVNEAAIYPITYKGITGIDAAVALQKDLYAAVRADPALDGAAVYAFTIGGADPSAFPSIGDISAYVDYANIHAYPPHGLRPVFVIHAAIDGGRTDAPSRPVVLTETGFYTLTNGVGWGGVPEGLQASYLIDEVLDEAAAGVARTYLYDLIDDGADPAGTNQEYHFGLFRHDGTPKPSAAAFHNLTTILGMGEQGATRPAGAAPFSFTATGIPYGYTGNTLQLDGKDGSHFVVAWNEEQLWDTDTLTARPATPYPVTVTLNATYTTVDVYDPMGGTDPVQVLHGVNQVALTLTDHPFVIRVEPDAPRPDRPAATPAVTPAVILGSGPDALILLVSEDAYLGDARFTVSVDGRQLGGDQVATAAHGKATQAFEVRGSFGPGTHWVGVDFLNDAYDGTAETDRNLFVEGASLNGTPLRASLAELGGGAQFFSFEGPATAAPITRTTIGTGPQVLELLMAEDAYAGDAQFLVAIDGTRLGGVQTLSALHGLGQSEALDIRGTFAPGTHQATITFINDRYDGTADTDRNLFVTGATLDGAPLPDMTLAARSNGPQTLAFAVRG